MNQAELKLLIKGALRRGNTLDSEISLYIEKAVEFIERNHKFTWMDRFGRFTENNKKCNMRWTYTLSCQTRQYAIHLFSVYNLYDEIFVYELSLHE